MSEKEIKKKLIGKEITDVGYLTKEEAAEWGWDKRPIVIELDYKEYIIPQRDDEGNNGGALCHYDYKTGEEKIIYTI